ncbi:MAG: ABC transporter ATP-binding protein [Rhizobiaceae bacterium]|nr:ABC transporter ATP-binding protein [Rhizobiaceae bacterium]
MKSHRHISWLWRELWSRRALFGAALFCTGASAGMFVLMPMWAQRLVGDVVVNLDTTGLALHLLLGLVIFITGSLLNFGGVYLMTRLSHLTTKKIRSRLFHHIMRASPRSLAQMSGGELVSSFSNDLQTFQEAVRRVVAVFAPSLILIVVFSAAMAWYSWLLFVCVVVLISPLTLVTSYFGNRLHGASHTTQEKLAGLVGRFEEMLDGTKEIKSFGREDDMLGIFDSLNEQALEAQLVREKIDSLHPAAVSLAAAIGIAAMIFLSAILLDRELISLETLTAFLVCLGLVYAPLQEASHSIGRLIQFSALMDRFEKLQALPLETGGDLPLPSEEVKGALRFDKVCFEYRPDGFQLKDFSLDIPAGQRVALVGPSGGGKSTILDLVPRFLTPDAGAVLIDGQDMADCRLSDLRSVIGIVFQQPVLFEGTLAENLRFGAPNATLDEIKAAARAANVDEFAIRMPGQYDARISAHGSNLSVGQRQRIAIARVLLKDPPILLLDEPTSALDAESERLVQDALEHASEGRTTLIVAHRFGTVRSAHRIVVVRDGEVIEDGTHDELFNKDGLYRKLSEQQFFGQVEEWALKPV